MTSVSVLWLLLRAQWREQPGRMAVTLLAIALGVSLGTAVYFVNAAALGEFTLAAKHLVGEADVVVRGAREGFDESLLPMLARDPSVAAVSPVLELEAAVPGRRDTLKVLALDPFRAAALQPALFGDIGQRVFEMLHEDAVLLSAAAAADLHLQAGEQLALSVDGRTVELPVAGVLAEGTYRQPLVVMDIASAQWKLNRLGLLNRIDLQLKPGTDAARFRADLEARLPAGAHALAPQIELDRAASATRAYRVNLNMLALVALFTGAFLVFSTQSLAVLRRRRSLALLRALGLKRGELRRALTGEGLVLGAAGSGLGVLLGVLLADAALAYLTADLGNGQLRTAGASLKGAPWGALSFFLIGTATAGFGALLPAAAAARQRPAQGLKGGNDLSVPVARRSGRVGAALIVIGAGVAFLPPLKGLPVFGYGAVALLLIGAVLLVPALTVLALALVPPADRLLFSTAHAQLRENVGLSALSLAAIVVSFSLMVAMATMVFSFRQSFEVWLDKLLPADLQVREPYDNDTTYFPPATQARITATDGVLRVEFRRTRHLLFDDAHAAVTLIVRGDNDADTASQLPLVTSLTPLTGESSAWISEAFADLFGYRTGNRLTLPLAGRPAYRIAGVWRDYARASGSIVVSHASYRRAGGDDNATEASIWIRPGADPAAVEAALRTTLPGGDAEFISSSALHERSVRIFDRAFGITYVLEIVAVLIGLTGVSFAASSSTLARRAEFGMLRHVGMLRRQVLGLVATEGTLTSAFGVAYGLVLGLALSLVLVYVVNRQSFNWSIDLSVPILPLLLLSTVLIGAAALTALVSGRAALSDDALRAVREDW